LVLDLDCLSCLTSRPAQLTSPPVDRCWQLSPGCSPLLTAALQARACCAVADDIMVNLRETYSIDHARGDSVLGSVMQFVYRALKCVYCLSRIMLASKQLRR
jgi:hypothetical protein